MSSKKDKVLDKDRFSIICPLDRCYITGSKGTLHLHEVFGGQNRGKSKEDGLVIALVPEYHNMSSKGVHFNKDLDDKIKQQAEKIWLDKYTDKNDTMENRVQQFIDRYGKNFIDY